MAEKPLCLTRFGVESLEVVLDENSYLGRNTLWERKILFDEKSLSLTGFVVKSLEVVLVEKLLLEEKTICGGGKSCWMKTSQFDWAGCLEVLK